MSQIFLFPLSIIGVLLFLSKKYVPFLLITTFIVFNGFGLLTIGRTNIDAFICMCIAILGLQLITKTKKNVVRKNKIGKTIVCLLTYVIIRAIASILIGEESAVYVIKELRVDLFMLSFFVFVQIDNTSISKFWRLLIGIFVIVGLVYTISFVAWMASGQTTELLNSTAVLALSAPLLFLLAFDKVVKRNRFLLIGMMVLFLLISFSRGIILAVGGALVYYFLFIKKNRKTIVFILLFLPIFYLLFSMVDSNKSENVSNMSTREEIDYALNLDSYDDFQHGSFGLRFAMVWEKAAYMSEHPEVFIWGVGAIHEDSPHNKFTFLVGSHKTKDDVRSKQQIDTNDVAFLSHWFRYGTIWLVLYFCFLIVSFKELKHNVNLPYVVTGLLVLVVGFVSSMSHDFFGDLTFMFIPLLLISRVYCPQKELKRWDVA